MASYEACVPQDKQPADIIIIWLDDTITDNGDLLLSESQTVLLPYIKSIQLFTKSLKCRKYIENIHDTRIFFVVSGSLGENLVPDIHSLSQLTFVYIFCAYVSKHETWAQQFNKIRGVFSKDATLLVKLKDDVCSLSNINFPFGFFDSSEETLYSLTKE